MVTQKNNSEIVSSTTNTNHDIQKTLEEALALALENNEGKIASYIPELASIPEELTAVSVTLNNGQQFMVSNADETVTTLQSAAKLVPFIGLLEEVGPQKVFSWVRTEPSGDDFASVARLDQFGPIPSNPMLNSGAIKLCNHIPGKTEERLAWLENWMESLFGKKLTIDYKVFASERRTGDRNRSIAYLLKSNDLITGDVDGVLETYFYLCSFQADVLTASYLPMLLARKGLDLEGNRIISEQTVSQVLSVMATCGLYNESGNHLTRTGLPAKSSVSGFILATAIGKAGITTLSPRVNRKGTSVRGEIMLEYISSKLGWHFAG